jgi:hypothetical protein
VVGADPGGDGELQLGRLGDPFASDVGRPERLRDNDFGVGQLPFEDGVRPVLVRSDEEFVPAGLEKVVA